MCSRESGSLLQIKFFQFLKDTELMTYMFDYHIYTFKQWFSVPVGCKLTSTSGLAY